MMKRFIQGGKAMAGASCAAAALLLLFPATGAAEEPRVAFVPQIQGIPYYVAMEQGGERAAERFGVEYVQQGPTSTNASDQLRVFDGFVNRGFDVVAISPVDVASLRPAIRRAVQRGTEVITSDADAPDTERSFFVAQALDADLGATVMDQLAERMGGSGKVAIVSDAPTIQSLNNWIAAIEARAAEAYPEVEITSVQNTNGTTEQAYRYAMDAMTRHPDLKAIVGIASTTCPGVAQAVTEADKIGEVITTGYCSPNTVREYIKSGAMPFSVLWNPADLGYLTVWAARESAAGKSFAPGSVEVPGLDSDVQWMPDAQILLLGDPMIFTADNVDEFDF